MHFHDKFKILIGIILVYCNEVGNNDSPSPMSRRSCTVMLRSCSFVIFCSLFTATVIPKVQSGNCLSYSTSSVYGETYFFYLMCFSCSCMCISFSFVLGNILACSACMRIVLYLLLLGSTCLALDSHVCVAWRWLRRTARCDGCKHGWVGRLGGWPGGS